MAEEFIEDIISNSEVPKTEAEMAAEIQGSDTDKAPEKQSESEDTKSTNAGREASPPDAAKNENKADEKASDLAIDPVKDLATQLGWREDHTGEDAVDAKTYILKSKDIQKSMRQHNKDLKDQLQGLHGSVNALKEHNENVFQSEIKQLTREVEELKKERRAAIELADVDTVDALDKQIDEKQKDINAPKPVDEQEQNVSENPVYDEWIEENEWYLENEDMANFADSVAQQYVGAPLERIYALVRNRVQEVFPDKFDSVKAPENKQQEVIKDPVGPKSPVESSSAKVNESSFTKADLTPDQAQIMRQFVQGGIMTEEQYIADIAKMQ